MDVSLGMTWRADYANRLPEGNEMVQECRGPSASPTSAKRRENRRPACLETGFRYPTGPHTGETPMLPWCWPPGLQLSEMRPRGPRNGTSAISGRRDGPDG